MRETQVTISYERKFSDGDYGSMGVSMSVSVDLDTEQWSEAEHDGVLLLDVLHDRAVQLRVAVLTELAQSGAERVAWAAKRELGAGADVHWTPLVAEMSPHPESLEDLPF